MYYWLNLDNHKIYQRINLEILFQDPIGIDKESNKIPFIEILGIGTDEVIEEVDLKVQVKKLT